MERLECMNQTCTKVSEVMNVRSFLHRNCFMNERTNKQTNKCICLWKIVCSRSWNLCSEKGFLRTFRMVQRISSAFRKSEVPLKSTSRTRNSYEQSLGSNKAHFQSISSTNNCCVFVPSLVYKKNSKFHERTNKICIWKFYKRTNNCS